MSQEDSANRVPTGSVSPVGALPTLPAGQPKVWKIRAIKNYPEAHNHVLVGKVLFRDKQYLCPIGRGSEPSY